MNQQVFQLVNKSINFAFFLSRRSNDWLSISKGEIGTATLMCGHKGDFTVLLSSGQADITFNTRGKDHRRGDGFQAWYEGVHEVVTGMQ